MLSVILYGRNDSHGYNLHKRGAISLNAIAHLLRDPDDELIFVDYNTPDDLPTFPEAIADTLTDQAKAKLRILRVRPAHHARFAAQTHLNALEPVARNVAVRRSNPANRWVLSTNTDMIFVPRAPGASLGDIVGALPDGFYHLPRFELPEALWESLDRRDAEGIVRAAGRWGLRHHLDEVVRSAGDNLFDGPGDFQLFLREDLFRIGGFDERMLKGWHADANVARRMRLLRGAVTSAEAWLRGYHCDHTRQASPYHKGDRVENDPKRFVDAVDAFEAPGQADSFGLADVAIEEIPLSNGSTARYLAALAATQPKGAETGLESAYTPSAYGVMTYPLDHVLPYLFDLVSCIPADARIGYLGARRDTARAFAAGWAAMGGAHPPLHPREADWLGAGAGLDLAAWAQQADVFVFEIGAEAAADSPDLSDDERARLQLVHAGMRAAFGADAERQREGAAPRRAVVINAINNSFEAMLFRWLAVTLTPFSSRIRHGFIVDPEAVWRTAPAPLKAAAAALRRETPVSEAERRACVAAVEASVALGRPTPDAWALADTIVALAKERAAGLAPVDPALLDALASGRTAVAAPLPVGLAPAAGAAVTNRLVRIEDWSDPDFLRMAYALFPNRRHDDPAERNAWTWERTALALAVNAAAPLADRPRVLVAAELPELLATMLSNLGAQVDVADPRTLTAGSPQSSDWTAALGVAIPSSAPRLGRIEAQREALAAGLRYDAVVLPQNALFALGRDGAADLLRAATDLLKPGGRLALCPLVLVNDVPPAAYGDNLTADLVCEGRFAGLVSEATALKVAGGLDAALSTATLATLPPKGEAPGAVPSLLQWDGDAVRAPAVFVFDKADAPADGESGWERVNLALRSGVLETGASEPAPLAEGPLTPVQLRDLARMAAESLLTDPLGSVLKRLAAEPQAARTPRSVRFAAGPSRLVLSGAVGRADPGVYDLRIQGAVEGDAAGAVQIVVMVRDTVAAQGVVLRGGAGEGEVRFTVDGPVAAPVAIALVCPADAAVEITDVLID